MQWGKGEEIAMALMSLQQLVDRTRAFIGECREVTAAQMTTVGEDDIDLDLLDCVERLMFAVNMTIDSAILLIEQKCVWDATILLRSALDGSARVCYLLSAEDCDEEAERLREYVELLPKAEMGALEQPVSGIINSVYYKGGAGSEDPFLDPFKRSIDRMKPREGEGKHLREVKARWNFFALSTKLKSENEIWEFYAPIFELRYSTSNQLIHKAEIGNAQMWDRNNQEPAYRELQDVTHSATVMSGLRFAIVADLRSLLARAGLDSTLLLRIMLKHRTVFDESEKIENAFYKEYKLRQ